VSSIVGMCTVHTVQKKLHEIYAPAGVSKVTLAQHTGNLLLGLIIIISGALTLTAQVEEVKSRRAKRGASSRRGSFAFEPKPF
jgi:hypothetical protein